MSGKLKILICGLLLLISYSYVVFNAQPGFTLCGTGVYSNTRVVVNAIGQSPASKTFGKENWESEIGSFTRTPESNAYTLHYKWRDYFNKSHELDLDISNELINYAIGNFGLTTDKRMKFYKTGFDGFLSGHPELLDITKAIQRKKGPVHLAGYNIVNPGTYNKFKEKCQEFEDGYLKANGFHVLNRGYITVDYSSVVRKFTPIMLITAKELLTLGQNNQFNLQGLIHLVMSYVQYIRYEIPPFAIGNRYIYGVWSPVETIVRGAGDCDTKAIFFSSVVNNYKGIKTIIVTIPGHAFNGMIGWHKRLPQDYVIKHKGLDVLLVDLTSDTNFNIAGSVHEMDKQNLRNRFPRIYETN